VSGVPNRRSPPVGRLPRGPVLVEQPSQLQGGGVRRDRQAGAILEALDASVGGKRVGGGGGPGVLPDNRTRDRASRPSIPKDDRLTLVGDPDPGDVRRRGARRTERLVDALLGSVPDPVHVELDPTGPRVVHGLPALRDRDRRAELIEENAARARGAVIDGGHELGGHRSALLRLDHAPTILATGKLRTSS
jgi:hypothetical protein